MSVASKAALVGATLVSMVFVGSRAGAELEVERALIAAAEVVGWPTSKSDDALVVVSSAPETKATMTAIPSSVVWLTVGAPAAGVIARSTLPAPRLVEPRETRQFSEQVGQHCLFCSARLLVRRIGRKVENRASCPEIP